MTVRVEGARELRRTMRKAGRSLLAMREAHREVAATVTRAASPPRVTGRLAGSVRPGATQTAALVRAGGARVPYAGVIHWGWAARNIEPQPFLTDAAHRTEPVWVDQYERAVDRVLATIRGDR